MPISIYQLSHKLSIIALSLACLSMLLAIVPQYVIEKKIKQLNEITQNDNSLISLEVKGLKLKFGHKNRDIDSHRLEEISNLKNLLQNFTIGVYVVSILSIFLGIYSVTKKQTSKIGVSSIVIASMALTWEYVAAGITLGVAVIIAFFLFINLS